MMPPGSKWAVEYDDLGIPVVLLWHNNLSGLARLNAKTIYSFSLTPDDLTEMLDILALAKKSQPEVWPSSEDQA
jgi:hypothetical protein